MKKVLALIDMLLSHSVYYRLIKFRLTYKNVRIAPSAKLIENGGSFSYATNNRIGDLSLIILTDQSTVSLKKNVWLGEGVYIEPIKGTGIVFQEGCSIQDRCRLIGEISIGKNTLLAPNVYISSGNHFFSLIPAMPIRFQDELVSKDTSLAGLRSEPVKIGDDCWIGTNVVVMRGVEVGKGSVIGANSVVTKSIPPYSIAVGAPAKVVKKRLDFSPPDVIKASNPEHQPYFYEGCMPYKNDVSSLNGLEISVSLDRNFTVFLSPGKSEKSILYIVFNCSVNLVDLHLQYDNVAIKVNKGRNIVEWPLKINSEYITKFEFEFIGSFHESAVFIDEAGIK